MLSTAKTMMLTGFSFLCNTAVCFPEGPNASGVPLVPGAYLVVFWRCYHFLRMIEQKSPHTLNSSSHPHPSVSQFTVFTSGAVVLGRGSGA